MTDCNIHPTALVAESAKLGQDVKIGPYAIIEEDVEVGDHCIIDAHAIILSHVKMGSRNHLHPHTVIGGLPQDVSFDSDVLSYAVIGDGNVFRECVTVNRATEQNGSTNIGSDCYFMNNSHVAHDCKVENNTYFASGATIGGFVTVGERVFLGGGAMVHQYCRVGELAMVSGVIGVPQDVIPFSMIAGGTPGKHYRLNTVGLRRAGITGERYKSLSRAFDYLKKGRPIDAVAETEEVARLKAWLGAKSKRGISAFVSLKKKGG